MRTRRFATAFLVAVASLAISSAASAQSALVRAQKYVLRVPLAALKLEGTSLWNGTATYTGTVEKSADGAAAVGGATDWVSRGYPDDAAYTLRKTRTDRDTGQFEVELARDTPNPVVVKLRFANESVARSIAPLVIIDSSRQADVAAWQTDSYAQLAKATLTGPLTALSAERQRALLEALRSRSIGKPQVVTFKDKTYIGVNFAGGEYVFNTLQMNQSARVARRTKDVLTDVKSLYQAIGGCPAGVDGVKVSYLASYKNFLREYETGMDSIEGYFPCDLIAKFQNADITSQALVNGSVILVGGDRVDVTLTQ